VPDEPIRVLQLNFHRGWGGQPQRILMLSRELAARGHAVALAVPGDGILARRARESGLAVFGDFRFRSPSHLPSFLRDVRRAREILADWRPDILHSHGSQDTWVTAVANRFGPRPRIPHLLTRHNTKKVSDGIANRCLYRHAIDRLVVVSGSVLDRYQGLVERGIVDPGKVPVIHSAIEERLFAARADRGRVRGELGVGDGDILVGCVGRLVPDKGQVFLLQAAARLIHGNPGLAGRLFVALAGVGTGEQALRSAASELGISSRVFFLGFREDVPDVTAAFDIAVLPSIDCDASSAVIKEAMATGRPVVATDIGGAREILNAEPGSPAGLIVSPGSAEELAAAIDRLIRDRELAAAFARNGPPAVSAHFTAEKLCEDYLRVYREMLRPGREAAASGGAAPRTAP
jgi:glycosyltransferase involved in cell wall biosynthesis